MLLLKPAAAGLPVDVHGPCFHQRDVHGLPSESMLKSMACAAAKGHDGVCGPFCGWRLCGCLWSMLLLEAMLMSLACVTSEGHVDV